MNDPHQHGRGVALADFNRDGKVDIVYGNWNGPHRLYLQMSAHGKVRFRVRRGLSFRAPSLPPPALSVALAGPGCSPTCASHQAAKEFVALQSLGAGVGGYKDGNIGGTTMDPNLGCCNVSSGPEQR